MIRCISMGLKFSKILFFILLFNISFAGQALAGRKCIITDAKMVLQMYQLMKDTHEILASKSMPYWVAAGTLLGAVRHEGIIPWADDLNICIDNKQINNFIALTPIFEQFGYKIVSSDLGFKIFPNNGLLFDNENESSLKVPVIDVLLYEHSGKDKFLIYFEDVCCARKIAIYSNELFPLKDYNFGSFSVKGPNKPSNYLVSCYGRNYMDATYGNNGSFFVKLSEKHREPAVPTERLKDRVWQVMGNQIFSLDVVIVNKENIESSMLLLEKLRPIFIEASAVQAEIQLKKEHVSEYKTLKAAHLTIKDVLDSRFNKIIEAFFSQCDSVRGAYIISVKDCETLGVVGYVIFQQVSMVEILKSMISGRYISSVLSLAQHLTGEKNKTYEDAYVLSVAILPSYQKRGLGKKLIQSALSQVVHTKSIHVLTDASKINSDVQNFYKHLDFKQAGAFLTSDNNKTILYSLDVKK